MDLNIALVFFAVSLLAELINISLINENNSIVRTNTSATAIAFIMFASTLFIVASFSIFSVALFIISLFRVINVSRVISDRMNKRELITRYYRTMMWLSLFSLICVYLIYAEYQIGFIYLSYAAFLGSVLLFVTTFFSYFRWRTKKVSENKEEKLPTVSVCIPARNETQDLPECIETVLASTYPKLEILVLDDCSHDKTPAIIKDYAHKGVRFIKGQEPHNSWVAKNAAMDKLFDESRGEIVIFAGVDVRFSSESVYAVVEQLEYGLFDMVSVLPRRSGDSEASVFIQPLRYWWEISVPRILGKRPPALSTIWAIRRKKLIEIGSFESVKRSVRPEAHFAKRLSDRYKFLLSGSNLGLSSKKAPREQFDTALRMRYPQTRRRPESVLALIAAELVIFLVPIASIYIGIRDSDSTLLILGILSLTLLVVINTYISYLSVKKTWLIGILSLPFLVIEEWYVLVRSMLAYEFGVVKWKERNICLPMLQVEKELPKI